MEITPNYTGSVNAVYTLIIYPTKRLRNTDTIEIRFASQLIVTDGNLSCTLVSQLTN